MEFALIAFAHFIALLSPGPDFFLVLQAALRMPRNRGLALCTGIAAANGIYVFSAVFGLELVRDWAPVMTLFRWLGGCYLIYIGVMLLRAPRRTIAPTEEGRCLGSSRIAGQALVGFASAALNPKNAIFYLSLFTAMVSVETPLTIRLFYGLWMTGVVFCWDAGLVLVLGRSSIRTRLGRGIFYLEKGAGAVLALFGLMLPFTV